MCLSCIFPKLRHSTYLPRHLPTSHLLVPKRELEIYPPPYLGSSRGKLDEAGGENRIPRPSWTQSASLPTYLATLPHLPAGNDRHTHTERSRWVCVCRLEKQKKSAQVKCFVLLSLSCKHATCARAGSLHGIDSLLSPLAVPPPLPPIPLRLPLPYLGG